MLEWESTRFQNKNIFFLAHQHDRVSLALRDKFVNQSGHKTDMIWPGILPCVVFWCKPTKQHRYNHFSWKLGGTSLNSSITKTGGKFGTMLQQQKTNVEAKYSGNWKIKN